MRKLTGILFLIFWVFSANAQTFSFQHIGVEEGLSQSVITTVSQDDNGVFWIGTMAGLTRYDGLDFDIKIKEDGLAENWITASMKDKNGNLWFGHWGGGVSMMHKESGEFQDMKFERFSNFKSVTSIVEDGRGDIWFGTKGNGVFKYESESNTIVSLSKEDGFQNNFVTSMCIDQFNNLWMGTKKGIVIYRMAKNIDDKGAFMLLTKSDGLSSDHIVHLNTFGKNSIMVATDFDGINIIGNVGKLNELTYKSINKSNGLPSNEITCLFPINENKFWIGTKDEGVIRYDVENNYFDKLSTRQGLNYFKVNTIFQDRESNIWIGTDLGLNLFRGDEFLIYDETDGLVNNVIWTIAEDSKNRLWMGTNEGLSRVSFVIDEKTENTNSVEVKNFTKKDGLSSNIVLSIFIDEDRSIWCGTGYGGISILNENGQKLKVIDSIGGLATNTVYSINKDVDGNHWVGTTKGVSKIDAAGNISNFTSADGLGGDNIYKIFRDSKNTLWFASIGGYLSKYENGQFMVYKTNEELSQKFITSITEDQEGNIWFGAYGSGIFKYDGKEFINYNTSNGLSSNSPYSLITDEYNNLWIGNSKGIDKFNIKDLTTKNYREKEGFMGVEPNPNAVFKDHAGNLWFGTIMGAVKFDLSEEKMNTTEPVTRLERIRVAHEIFDFPEDHEFSYNENHLTFHYIGVSLTNPEHIEYKVMLEGFDNNWSPITNDQDVVYSNLPSGSYTFKVMAANNDGIWNELPISYSFKINPPFWMTWWFYTICAFVLLESIYIIDKIRMKNLIAAKEQLEKTVAERTAEVVEQKKVVEEKNHEILDSIKYAKRIQDAILPPLKFVKEHLKDSFILFKPKDIVAGDFYFFEVLGDEIYFAAADCTGHGVPGAMVSVVCSNALNRAVHEMKITEPAKILDKVRELVVETFQKSENEVKDGMDISFCRLNLKTKKLSFTGAHNALYRVSAEEDATADKIINNDHNVLMEYKGDKQPIGKYTFEKPFTQREIQLIKGDTIYLSTDGYADQFGGDKERKFMYKPFKEMLLRLHAQPVEDQMKEIDQAFENWRGNLDQIDDVCVIGVKV